MAGGVDAWMRREGAVDVHANWRSFVTLSLIMMIQTTQSRSLSPSVPTIL